MARAVLAVAALPFLSVSCAHDRVGWHDTSLLRSTEFPEDTIAALNETANNPLKSQEDQARAIFTLFGRYLQPGCSSAEFREVMTDLAWLRNSKLDRIAYYTGWIPVDHPFGDTVFCLYLFAVGSDDRARMWHIYFRLTGHCEEDDALAFLRGSTPVGRATRMAEFALCFPHSIYHPLRSMGRIERFSARGVHTHEEMGR